MTVIKINKAVFESYLFWLVKIGFSAMKGRWGWMLPSISIESGIKRIDSAV